MKLHSKANAAKLKEKRGSFVMYRAYTTVELLFYGKTLHSFAMYLHYKDIRPNACSLHHSGTIEFSEGEETIRMESVSDEIFEFDPTSSSTPAKRKKKACEHKSTDSSMGKEPLWLVHNYLIEKQEETSKLGHSEEDDDESSSGAKNGDKLEGKRSTHCSFSYFKDKAYF